MKQCRKTIISLFSPCFQYVACFVDKFFDNFIHNLFTSYTQI